MSVKIKDLRKEKSSHEFSSSRRIGTPDTAMIADPGFKKQLHALDEELDVVWNFDYECWEIWRFPGQGKEKVKKWKPDCHHVMSVVTAGRSYRELGADILLKLQQGDSNKFSPKQLLAYFEQQDEMIQREKTRRLMDKIHSMNVEILRYTGIISAQVPKEYIFETPQTLRVRRAISGGL